LHFENIPQLLFTDKKTYLRGILPENKKANRRTGFLYGQYHLEIILSFANNSETKKRTGKPVRLCVIVSAL
jgi:hypothetical protein